uniref:MFS transporter n=1 Tax=uncultured Methanofollis sp. TaxID=262500 RepID=UPI002617EB03
MLKELKSVLSLSYGHLVIDIYSPVIPAILPLLIATHGWSYFLAGLLIAAFNITSSLLQPAVGYLSDRRGFSLPFAVPFLIASLCIGAFGLIGNYPLLLICAALAAFGSATFHPLALSAVNRVSRKENRGRLTSIFVIGGNIGFALGPVLAGLAVSALGLPGILVLAVIGVVTALLSPLIFPREDMGREDTGHASRTGVCEAPVSCRPIALIVAVGALRSWVIYAAIAYLPTYFHVHLGADLVTANALVSLMLVAGVAGQYVGGVLSDTYGRKEWTVFGLAASVPFFVLFLVATGPLSYAALLIFSFFLWSTFSVTV